MKTFDVAVDRRGTASLKWDRYKDRDILPFWVADMDFPVAPQIQEALQRRLEHGVFGYTLPREEVVEATLDYLRDTHGVQAEKEWLVWLPGLVPALNTACRAFARRGEAVMACSPVYPPFLTAPINQHRKLVEVRLLRGEDRYTFDWEQMEAKVTLETRLFNLCNPHNPVGRVFSRDELERLTTFCGKHDLVICSDEIHCDLVLEEKVKHTSILSLGPTVAERSILLMAPSKTYNTPGLACAFAAIPNPRLRVRFQKAMRGMLTEVNVFGYEAAGAAYRHGEQWRQELIRYLRGNRDYLSQFLKERMPELKMYPLEATYLAWIDPTQLQLENPHEFFENAGVGLSSGRDFGEPGMLRMNFGCPRPMLEEGLRRMEAAILKHRTDR